MPDKMKELPKGSSFLYPDPGCYGATGSSTCRLSGSIS